MYNTYGTLFPKLIVPSTLCLQRPMPAADGQCVVDQCLQQTRKAASSSGSMMPAADAQGKWKAT